MNIMNLTKLMMHEMGSTQGSCLLPVCLDGCVVTLWSATQKDENSNNNSDQN